MRILVADDDSYLREKITDMLRTAGHEVIEAKNGREAFHKVVGAAFDAVITDMRMPPESGLTVLQAMYRGDTVPAYVHSSENTFTERGVRNTLDNLQKQIPEIFDFAEFHLKDRDHGKILGSILTFIEKVAST